MAEVDWSSRPSPVGKCAPRTGAGPCGRWPRRRGPRPRAPNARPSAHRGEPGSGVGSADTRRRSVHGHGRHRCRQRSAPTCIRPIWRLSPTGETFDRFGCFPSVARSLFGGCDHRAHSALIWPHRRAPAGLEPGHPVPETGCAYRVPFCSETPGRDLYTHYTFSQTVAYLGASSTRTCIMPELPHSIGSSAPQAEEGADRCTF